MRGKNKIESSALVLCLAIASLMVFGVPSVFADPARIQASSIVSPLLGPGSTFTTDVNAITSPDRLWSFNFTLTYDTSFLTATGVTAVRGSPSLFVNLDQAKIDDAAGTVTLAAHRATWVGASESMGGYDDDGNPLPVEFGNQTYMPLIGSNIKTGSELVYFQYYNEAVGTGDNETTIYYLAHSPSVYETVYVNGTATEDVIIDSATGMLNFTTPPGPDLPITADYGWVRTDYTMNYATTSGLGSITFTTAPPAGTIVLLEYRYRSGLRDKFAVLLGLIKFRVDGRGKSTMGFGNVVFKDVYDPPHTISVTKIAGLFDNRLQGTMTVPHILDTSKVGSPTNPSFLEVFIEASDIQSTERPWGGYQFTLNWDPNMLMPITVDILGGFDPDPVFLDMSADYITLAATGGNLATTADIARIIFGVINNGTTPLTLSTFRAVDIYGYPLEIGANDGGFGNVENFSFSLNTMFVESRRWSVSMDGETFTLTAQFTNTGAAGYTKVRGKFVIYDRLGGVVADLTTDSVVAPMPGVTTRLSGSIKVLGLPTDALYIVEGTIQYVDSMGTWVTGHKGSPTSTRMSMIKDFVLLP